MALIFHTTPIAWPTDVAMVYCLVTTATNSCIAWFLAWFLTACCDCLQVTNAAAKLRSEEAE